MFELIKILVCPECGGRIKQSGSIVRCGRCVKEYAFNDGIFKFFSGNLSRQELYQQGFYDKLYSSEAGRQVYDRGYTDNYFFKYLSEKYFFADIYKAVKPGDTILDLGCGGGNIARNLSEKLDINLVNLDISENALRHAARCGRVKSFYVQASSFTLPFADSTFDCIIADAFLHHIDDISHILREAKRVLKKGGTFFAFEPLARYSWVSLWLDIFCPSKFLYEKITGLHLKPGRRQHPADLTLRISSAAGAQECGQDRHFFKDITEYKDIFTCSFGGKNVSVKPVLFEYLPPRVYFIKSLPLVKAYLRACDLLSKIYFFRKKSRFVLVKAVNGDA